MACPSSLNLKNEKDALKNNNDKNKLECNRELLSACDIATSATENENSF